MHVPDVDNKTTPKKEINASRSSQETINAILNDSEHFRKLQEKINNLFSESEQQNNDMILKVKKDMVNQTKASILRAEEQNDDVINKIMYNHKQINNKSLLTLD